jgi:hypothetical protein
MDDYRVNAAGTYVFDPAMIKADVSRMKTQFREALMDGVYDVILDNVHSRLWEYEWALGLAKEHGYVIHVIEVQADLMTCWSRQTHTVPWDKLLEIFKRWEHVVRVPGVEDILATLAKWVR